MVRLMRTLALTGFSSLLWSASWTPIPQSVWDLSPELAKSKGAVICSERMRMGVKVMEFSARIRIFTEAGMVAAEFSNIPEEAKLEGRTVYPDGSQVAFNSTKDMKKQTVKAHGGESKSTVLVPPGLKANCVVELRWRIEPYTWGSTSGEYRFWILNKVPTLESVLDLAEMLPAASTIQYSNQRPIKVSENGYKSLVFTNLPASENSPYNYRPTNGEPLLTVFHIPDWLKFQAEKPPAEFWNAYGKRYFTEYLMEEISKGWSWGSFSKEVLAGLPEGDQLARAREIMLRLRERIALTSELTFKEKELFAKEDLGKPPHDFTLSEAVKRRWATRTGQLYLAFQLLRDAGMKPSFVLAGDRNEKRIAVNQPNIYQFDAWLLGLEKPGAGWLILDPGNRTLPVGTIASTFQGSTALAINPDSGNASTITLASQEASHNVRTYAYTHAFKDGKQSMTFHAAYQGLPEGYERDEYFSLSPAAQVEHLKTSFSEERKDWAIQKAVVHDATDLRKPLQIDLEADREYEDARRLEIVPFPGLPWAMSVPDNLPAVRTQPIEFGYARTFSSSARISLPAGYRLVQGQSMKEENEFGEVTWNAEADAAAPGEVRAAMRVLLRNAFSRDFTYTGLRRFLAWISEAQKRTVLVEKVS